MYGGSGLRGGNLTGLNVLEGVSTRVLLTPNRFTYEFVDRTTISRF